MRNKYKCKKLGDLFRYSIGRELPEINANVSTSYHTETMLVLMFSNELLTIFDTKYLQTGLYKHLALCGGGRLNAKSSAKEYGQRIVECLKKNMSFGTLDEMTELLNRYEIPTWMEHVDHFLFQNLPNLAIMENHLFYLITSGSDKGILQCVDVRKIDERTPEVFSQLGYSRVACGIEDIIGMEPLTGHLYLETKDGNFFIDMDCRDETFAQTIVNMKVITAMGRIPVGIHKGYLSYRLGEKIIPVKPYDEREAYSAQNGCFFVEPDSNSPFFFKPYILTMDGERRELPKEAIRDYLWIHLRDSIMLGVMDNKSFPVQTESLPAPKEMTWREISGCFEKLLSPEERCCHKRWIALESLFEDIMLRHVGRDDDVTDWLILFCNVGRRLGRKFLIPFTEELVFSLRQIEAKCTADDRFTLPVVSKKLEEETSKIFNHESEKKYVGYFTIRDGKILDEKCLLEDADSIGYMRGIVANEKGYEGMVFFYPNDGSFVVQVPNRLEQWAYDEVQTRFGIERCRVRMQVVNQW